jgi:hypothetical protein
MTETSMKALQPPCRVGTPSRFVCLTQRRQGANYLRSLYVLAPLREIPKLFPLNSSKTNRQKLPIAGSSICRFVLYPAFAKSFSRGA